MIDSTRLIVAVAVIVAATVVMSQRPAQAFNVQIPYSGQLAEDGELLFSPGGSSLLIVVGEMGNNVDGAARYDSEETPIPEGPGVTRFDVEHFNAITFNLNDFHLAVDQMTVTRTRGATTEEYVFSYPPDPAIPPPPTPPARIEGGYEISPDQIMLTLTLTRTLTAGDPLPTSFPEGEFLGGEVSLTDVVGNDLIADILGIPEPASAALLASGLVLICRRRA